MFFKFVVCSLGAGTILSVLTGSYIPMIAASFLLYLLLNLREKSNNGETL
jgi:hypothetical protein